MAAAGLSPLEALRGATVYPARTLRRPAVTATIAPGQNADLVLLRADPLLDIRHAADIDAVILRGRYLDRAALARLLVSAEDIARQ